VKNLKQDLNKLEKQESNLLELRLNDSVTLELYNSKLTEIKKNRDKTENELNQNSNKLAELKQFKKKIKNSKSIKLDVNTFKDNIKQLVKRIEIKRFDEVINNKPIKHWFKTRTFQVTLEFIDGQKSVYVCAQNNWKPFKKPKNSNKYFVHSIPKYFKINDFIP
jgi:seryl-tRNA synthetase